MTQGDKQEAAHAAWKRYRDEQVEEGRHGRRNLRAREFFAGFHEGREYQKKVVQANEQLLNLVTWIEERPDMWEQYQITYPESIQALRDLFFKEEA